MNKLEEIIADLKILTPVMTNDEMDKATAAVVEAQYHAKAQLLCLDRITAVITSVQERRA